MSGSLSKKRHPMLKNRISWDGYNLKVDMKSRGFDILYKEIPSMESGGKYQLTDDHDG